MTSRHKDPSSPLPCGLHVFKANLALELVKNLGFSKTSKLIERLGFSEITSDLQTMVVK